MHKYDSMATVKIITSSRIYDIKTYSLLGTAVETRGMNKWHLFGGYKSMITFCKDVDHG